jgi:hypothetical protein
MKKISKPYIGITLTFASRTEGRLAIEDVSFLIKASTLKEAISVAKKIGEKRSRGSISHTKDFIKYLGIYDIFGVVGPLGHGAMMGQTSKFSYKSLYKVKRLLARYTDYTINQKGCDTAVNDLYIVKFVYFLGAPVPYQSRRALVCWGIIKSHDKSKILNESIKLAQSAKFKQKIILRDYEKIFSSDVLQFVGVNDIRPLFEKLREGNYFLNGYKGMKKISDLNKVVLPDSRIFKEVFAE